MTRGLVNEGRTGGHTWTDTGPPVRVRWSAAVVVAGRCDAPVVVDPGTRLDDRAWRQALVHDLPDLRAVELYLVGFRTQHQPGVVEETAGVDPVEADDVG